MCSSDLIRHDQGAADIAGRTDRAEDVARAIALILRLAWTCAFFGPLINQAVLLADAGFVLEPNLNGSALGQTPSYRRQLLAEALFLKASSTSSSCFGCRGRGERCA